MDSQFISRAELSPPELSSPSPGSVTGIASSTTITIGWNPSPGADAYDVALRNQDGVIMGLDSHVGDLSRNFSFSQIESEGTYTVELTSIRNNPPPGAPARSETAIYRFEVKDFVRYSPAIPVFPADDSTLDPVKALRSGNTLRWRQDSRCKTTPSSLATENLPGSTKARSPICLSNPWPRILFVARSLQR